METATALWAPTHRSLIGDRRIMVTYPNIGTTEEGAQFTIDPAEWEALPFENGASYVCFWPTWSDASDVQTVVSRTKCFATFEDKHGQMRRVKVHTDERGEEWALPYGTYSMAATISTGRRVPCQAVR